MNDSLGVQLLLENKEEYESINDALSLTSPKLSSTDILQPSLTPFFLNTYMLLFTTMNCIVILAHLEKQILI